MAITLGLLPEWAREDTRYTYSGYDANQNLYFGPASNNGANYTTQASTAWATATQIFADPNQSYVSPAVPTGATASYNLLMLSYQDIFWWVPSQTPVKVPAFLTGVATLAGWTVT